MTGEEKSNGFQEKLVKSSVRTVSYVRKFHSLRKETIVVK